MRTMAPMAMPAIAPLERRGEGEGAVSGLFVGVEEGNGMVKVLEDRPEDVRLFSTWDGGVSVATKPSTGLVQFPMRALSTRALRRVSFSTFSAHG